MQDYIDEFSSYLTTVKNSSENTKASYLRDVQHYCDFLNQKKIQDPKNADQKLISAYLKDLLSKGKSGATVLRTKASIKSFYSFLMQFGVILINPATNVETSKPVQKMPQILTSEEVDLLLSQPDTTDYKGIRDKAMLELLYATGIRVTELLDLNIDDVNLEIGLCKMQKRQGTANYTDLSFGGFRASGLFEAGEGDFIKRYRTALALCQHQGRAHDAPGFFQDRKALSGKGRHQKTNHAAYAPAFLCNASDPERRRPRIGKRNDGACRYIVHTGVRPHDKAADQHCILEVPSEGIRTVLHIEFVPAMAVFSFFLYGVSCMCYTKIQIPEERGHGGYERQINDIHILFLARLCLC